MWISTGVHVCIQCVRGGGGGNRGAQTDKHLPPNTFTGQFFKKSRHLGFWCLYRYLVHDLHYIMYNICHDLHYIMCNICHDLHYIMYNICHELHYIMYNICHDLHYIMYNICHDLHYIMYNICLGFGGLLLLIPYFILKAVHWEAHVLEIKLTKWQCTILRRKFFQKTLGPSLFKEFSSGMHW